MGFRAALSALAIVPSTTFPDDPLWRLGDFLGIPQPQAAVDLRRGDHSGVAGTAPPLSRHGDGSKQSPTGPIWEYGDVREYANYTRQLFQPTV